MKLLVLIIPLASAAIFMGSADVTSQYGTTATASTDIAATPSPEAANTQKNADDYNPFSAWVLTTFFGADLKSNDVAKSGAVKKTAKAKKTSRKSAKKQAAGFGFKYGNCSNVGQAKRCKAN